MTDMMEKIIQNFSPESSQIDELIKSTAWV